MGDSSISHLLQITVSVPRSITCNITVDHKMKSSYTRQWWKTPRRQLKDKYSSPDKWLPQRWGEEELHDDALNTFSSVTTVTTGSANVLFIQNCWSMFWKHCSRVCPDLFSACSVVLIQGVMKLVTCLIFLPEVKWVAAAGRESGGTDKIWAVSEDLMSQSVLWIEKGEKRRQGWRDLREVISPCIKAPV